MHCRATTGVNNIKPPADQLHPLLHAKHANTNLEPGLLFHPIDTGRDSTTQVANFQREIRVAIHSYLGFLTPRMSMDVGEALLHYSE